jgi:hemoglobin/transferrin/lactoferrin receptor protein
MLLYFNNLCAETVKNNIRPTTMAASVALACQVAFLFSISNASSAQIPSLAKPIKETVLSEVTVSGTRTDNSVDEVAATVTVTTAKQIETRLVQDIRDLVRYEPNISVGNSPSRFGLTGFNIRGIEGNRILMQVDGVRLPDTFSIGAFAFATRDTIDVDLLKSVEILRGPGSSLYGSDALGGVVSFFTKDPADLLRETKSDVYASLKATSTSVDRSQIYAATLAAGRDWPVQMLVNVNRREGKETKNFGINDIRGSTRTAPNPIDAASTNGLLKLVWQTSATGPALKLTLESRDAATNVDVATLNNLSPKTASLFADDTSKRERITGELEWKKLGFIDTLRANIYQQQSETRQLTRERRDTTTATCSGVTTNTNTCFREILFSFDQKVDGLSLQGVSTINRKSVTQRLSMGLDYSKTRFVQSRDGLQTIVSAAGVSTSSPNVGADVFPVRDFPLSTSKQTGLYVQDEIFMLDGALTITPSIRYDRFDLSPELDNIFAADNPGVVIKGLNHKAASPRVGALWKILPSIALYAQYAEGFRSPPYNDVNFGFTNFAGGYTAISNPSLKPEKSRGVEYGIRGSVESMGYSVTAFSNRYTDFISSLTALTCPGDPLCSPLVPLTFQSINIGRVKISGWEVKANWRLDDLMRGLKLIASVGETKGDNLVSGLPLDSVDPRKTVVGLKYDAPSTAYGLEAILTNNAAKTRTSTATIFKPESSTVIDLFAYWQPLSSIRLNVGVFNVTNKKYWQWSDVRGIAATSVVLDRFTQPGRNVSISAQFIF